MKTIKMKATKLGAPHGHTVMTFEEGRTYETSDDLADIFVADGHATHVGTEPEPSKDTKKVKAEPSKDA